MGMDTLASHHTTAASAAVGPVSNDSLANARRQVRRLSHGGREALLRALLEQLEEEPGHTSRAPKKDYSPGWRPSPPLESSPSMPSLTASPTSPRLSYFPSFKSTPRTSVSSNGSRLSIRKSLVPPPLNVSKSVELPTPPTPPSTASTIKPTAPTPKTSKKATPKKDVQAIPASPSSTRAYWCTYCGEKFDHRFEWKRHDEEVHERPKQYPCPSRKCKCVFYSAHSFNIHHRTAHGCLTCPHSDKVVKKCKPKRAWGCGFCAAFLGSLERYHEHVALHFESGKTLAHWHHEHVIYGLLHQPVIHPMWKSLQAAKAVHLSEDHRPKLSWDKESTGRTPGFAQAGVDAPGQLQDLLEYFDPVRDNAAVIVQLADDEAIHVNVSVEEDPTFGKAEVAASASIPLSNPPDPIGKGKAPATLLSRSASTSFQPTKWGSVFSNPAPAGSARPTHMRSNSVSGTETRRSERPLPRVLSQVYQPATLRRPTFTVTPPDETSGQDLSTRLQQALDSPTVSRGLKPKPEMDTFSDWNSMADTMVDGPMTPLSPRSPRSPRGTGGFAATNPFRNAPPLPPLPSEWMARV